MFAKTTVRMFVLAALIASTAYAELKIGYINSEEIFHKYKGTQDAQEEFDKVAAKVEQKATNMKNEIKELKEQLERQSLLLSEERKKELENKIKTKMAEFEQFIATNYGRDGKLIVQNAEMTKPIIEKINKILEKLANEENYDFILDARMGGIVYAKKGYDLTDRVLKTLNNQ